MLRRPNRLTTPRVLQPGLAGRGLVVFGACQVWPAQEDVSPSCSLTIELKEGKRRRRSPGGSGGVTRVAFRIIERLWRYCVSKPSPKCNAFGATRVWCVECEGARYADILEVNLQAKPVLNFQSESLILAQNERWRQA